MENSSIINFSDFFKSNNIDDAAKKSFKEEFKDFIAPIKENTEIHETELITEDVIVEEVIEEEVIEEIVDNTDYYKLYSDKNENFICSINVEGANLNDTSARLIIEMEQWSLVFSGEIDKHGNCIIPIKKLNIFQEGAKGIIKLEVNADNTMFIPFESPCEINMSKKVSIKMNEKIITKKPTNTGVKVQVKR